MKKRMNHKLTGKVFLTISLIVMITLFLTACTNDSAKMTKIDAAATREPTMQPTEAPTVQPTKAPTVQHTDELVEEHTDELMEEVSIDASRMEPIYVKKENYVFSVSGQMAENVFCREHAEDPENKIEFYTVLNEQEYVIFTLLFNQNEGDIVHMISDTEGNKIPVAFIMNTLPEGLEEEYAEEFYTAQGVVNEIIEAIQAK